MRFRKFGMKGGRNVEKVKSFIIFVLTVILCASYSMIFYLWTDNRALTRKINDVESELRVYRIIEQTGKNGG